MLYSLVLKAYVLDTFPWDQHVNTWIWLASTVTNSSAFGIEGGLTAADLLTMCFTGVPTPVLQDYTMLNAFDICVPPWFFFWAGNGCTPRNITRSVAVDYLLLWHHKRGSGFEGICCFNTTDESASLEDDIRHPQDLMHQTKQPTGGAWLAGWVGHLIQSTGVVICLFLFLYVFITCFCKLPGPTPCERRWTPPALPAPAGAVPWARG